jgi:hypothetical protein
MRSYNRTCSHSRLVLQQLDRKRHCCECCPAAKLSAQPAVEPWLVSTTYMVGSAKRSCVPHDRRRYKTVTVASSYQRDRRRVLSALQSANCSRVSLRRPRAFTSLYFVRLRNHLLHSIFIDRLLLMCVYLSNTRCEREMNARYYRFMYLSNLRLSQYVRVDGVVDGHCAAGLWSTSRGWGLEWRKEG